MNNNDNIKIYLAAPIVNIPEEWKEKISTVYELLKKVDPNLYNPAEHGVPNAWGMSMEEWSKCIFALDVVAIDACDWVVVCDFGRKMTSGTAWETGYAFGKEKKILIIRMSDDTDYSVMMNGCSANSITYNDFYDELVVPYYDDKSKIIKNRLFVERGRLEQDVTFN